MNTMRILLVLLPTTITMVVGFQSTKLPFVMKPQAPTAAIVEMSLKKKSSNNNDDNHLVDSLVHPWIEKSVQTVSTFVIGWTLASSIAMAANTDMLLSTTATTTTIDDSIPVTVVTSTAESVSSQQQQQLTESSPTSINEISVDAMFVNAGMTFIY